MTRQRSSQEAAHSVQREKAAGDGEEEGGYWRSGKRRVAGDTLNAAVYLTGATGRSEPTGGTDSWMCGDTAWEEPLWDDGHPKLQ